MKKLVTAILILSLVSSCSASNELPIPNGLSQQMVNLKYGIPSSSGATSVGRPHDVYSFSVPSAVRGVAEACVIPPLCALVIAITPFLPAYDLSHKLQLVVVYDPAGGVLPAVERYRGAATAAQAKVLYN
jgi:hypothetical protein